jgi:tRNA pseudouridine38-40 synthase
MENIKLVLEYDGTRYVGWQIQPNGPSIQGELEKSLGQMLQEPVTVIGAGRTDAGVHARGQVASFKVSRSVELPLLIKGLNALLPPDIAVLSAESAPQSFHARHSARGRMYRYYLSLRPTAIQRNYSWYVGGYKIDPKRLDDCAEMVLGEKDFTSFCKGDAFPDQVFCNVQTSTWRILDSSMVYEVRANRFLYGMVRTLVGTMVEIGRGHRSFDQFEEILNARDRASAGMSAPAKGLFLEEVTY